MPLIPEAKGHINIRMNDEIAPLNSSDKYKGTVTDSSTPWSYHYIRVASNKISETVNCINNLSILN